jgi:hypothetical protein
MSMETWMWTFLVVSIVTVVIGYGIAKLILSNHIKLHSFMGTGSWKFSESWASTLTASGAVLGLVLAAEVLPPETEIPKKTYVMLNLMFGVIIVAAALIYNAIRWPRKGSAEKGQNITTIKETHRSGLKLFVVEYEEQKTETTENQGFVIVFLIASAMILWALLGQLVTAWYLLGEMTSLTSYIDTIFRWLIRASVVLTIIYGVASVPWTLYNQVNRDNKDWILI